MARFSTDDNLEQVTSKEQAVKIEAQKKSKISNSKKGIDKRKLIVYSVFGTLFIIIIILISFTFDDGKKKQINDIEAPVSETEKYNSKLEALGEENKNTYNQNVDLTETFSTKKDEEKKNEQEELRKQIEEVNAPSKEKVEKIKHNQYNNNHYVNNTPQNAEYKEPIKQPLNHQRDIEIKKESGFFSGSESENKIEKVILYACIHTDQTVLDGNRVKMRLTKGTTIDGNYFPVNTILYGTAKIKPNRLIVLINKINQTDVELEIFDAEDSNNGIYVETPNLNAMLKKELQKEALEEDDLERIPFSKTLTNLLSKKAKEERIELLNNYKIIIKHEKKNK
ncbi:MAG: conjugative transposon protein TraM [Flavobacterium sp.]|nr:conjugative transposon protein TraM [Flavobacterium sp.]